MLETYIRYELINPDFVSLKIYNSLGEEVITLDTGRKMNGNYSLTWDRRDRFGKIVTSGVYWLKMQTGSSMATQKMVVIR
jgi:flagellar hook assembly protein FlgD